MLNISRLSLGTLGSDTPLPRGTRRGYWLVSPFKRGAVEREMLVAMLKY